MNFKHEKTEQFEILFVNTIIPPVKMIPLNHFKREEGKYYRLYEVTYLQDEIIYHTVLQWHEVQVKHWHRDSLNAVISICSGASEFII